MSLHFSCPQGHRWESQGDTVGGAGSTVCPVCGSTAGGPLTAAPEALPPDPTGAGYQARHVASGRLVAIKRMLEPLDPGDVERARFQAEADALAPASPQRRRVHLSRPARGPAVHRHGIDHLRQPGPPSGRQGEGEGRPLVVEREGKSIRAELPPGPLGAEPRDVATP